jgi:hypothetical protein
VAADAADPAAVNLVAANLVAVTFIATGSTEAAEIGLDPGLSAIGPPIPDRTCRKTANRSQPSQPPAFSNCTRMDTVFFAIRRTISSASEPTPSSLAR